MCGIAGIYTGREYSPPDLDEVKRMVGMLHHRGPDETGIYIDDMAALGHARLSIIDLDQGTQPIHNEDQTLWITFNGEVFNYPELREELLAAGHQFTTATDTEVILHLYEDLGPDCLKRLNGQFALAIWDTRRRHLFLARDRFGIRPLHYTTRGGRFCFASEIKALLAGSGQGLQFDPVALDQVFTLWAPLAGRTAFEGIHEIPPGHFCLVDEEGPRLQAWWRLTFAPVDEQVHDSLPDIVEGIRERLRDAVRIRLRADVPVGTYVSGGLDSSGVTALASEQVSVPLQTFGIRFEEDDFDEGPFQQQAVAHLGVQHQELQAGNNRIGEGLAETLWHGERPLVRTAPVPLFLLSRQVTEADYKVVVTGEGADEIFGGYHLFREAKIRRFWARDPDSLRRARLLERLYPYVFKDARARALLPNFYRTTLDHSEDPLFSHRVRWHNTARLRTFFSPALHERLDGYAVEDEVRERLPSEFDDWDDLSKAQYLEATIFMSQYLLSSQGDRPAMAHSVEIRLPFLDPAVVEYMSRVPAHYKMRGLREKFALKKAFRAWLPEEIVSREKHPYRAPIRACLLDGAAGEMTRELLCESSIRETGLFDASKVKRLICKLERPGPAGELDGMALVAILSTQLLHHQFVQGFPYRESRPCSPNRLIDRRSETCASTDRPRGKGVPHGRV